MNKNTHRHTQMHTDTHRHTDAQTHTLPAPEQLLGGVEARGHRVVEVLHGHLIRGRVKRRVLRLLTSGGE